MDAEIVRLSIFVDFSFRPLPVWIPASGMPLVKLQPDPLVSFIIDDFLSGRLLAWILTSGFSLARLRSDSSCVAAGIEF